MVRESEDVSAQACNGVAASTASTVAAAASSGTSVHCPRRNFGIRIISVMLLFRGFYFRRDVSIHLQVTTFPSCLYWKARQIASLRPLRSHQCKLRCCLCSSILFVGVTIVPSSISSTLNEESISEDPSTSMPTLSV